MKIRFYRKEDERGWVRCRVLSFLDTAYFDNVLKEKERYENPSIELVAVEEGQIVGLLDIEYEVEEKTVCSRGAGVGGDRKSTRLNSSHVAISYAVFCLKKKKYNELEA